jgi:UDP-glucose 6-dehydrogenase
MLIFPTSEVAIREQRKRHAPAQTSLDDYWPPAPSSLRSIFVVKTLREDCRAVRLTRDAYAAADRADAVVVIAEWPAFRLLEAAALSRVMRGNVVVDGRNCLPDNDFAE